MSRRLIEKDGELYECKKESECFLKNYVSCESCMRCFTKVRRINAIVTEHHTNTDEYHHEGTI